MNNMKKNKRLKEEKPSIIYGQKVFGAYWNKKADPHFL